MYARNPMHSQLSGAFTRGQHTWKPLKNFSTLHSQYELLYNKMPTNFYYTIGFIWNSTIFQHIKKTLEEKQSIKWLELDSKMNIALLSKNRTDIHKPAINSIQALG